MLLKGTMSVLSTQRVAYFNGKIVPEREVVIPFRDRSFTKGDGVFDMTRSFNGHIFKIMEHCAVQPCGSVRASLVTVRSAGALPLAMAWTIRGDTSECCSPTSRSL